MRRHGGFGGPTVPTQTQPVPTIVYTLGDTAKVRVVLTNLDGSDTRVLPCPEVDCWDGEISPDGKQLLVTAADAAGVRQQYIMNTDGSNPRLVATAPIASYLPTWKHDGRGFYSYRPNGSMYGQSRAYVTVVATGESQPIESTAFQSGLPTESPDGKRLVFSSNRRSVNDELFSLDLTTSGATPVPISIAGLPANVGTSNQPRFSPSGDEIVFTYTPTGTSNFDIWIMSAAGTNARPFANSALRESAADWSPDGAYIVYVRSPALGINEIVIARVSDGSVVRTIPEPQNGTVNNPRWGLLR